MFSFNSKPSNFGWYQKLIDRYKSYWFGYNYLNKDKFNVNCFGIYRSHPVKDIYSYILNPVDSRQMQVELNFENNSVIPLIAILNNCVYPDFKLGNKLGGHRCDIGLTATAIDLATKITNTTINEASLYKAYNLEESKLNYKMYLMTSDNSYSDMNGIIRQFAHRPSADFVNYGNRLCMIKDTFYDENNKQYSIKIIPANSIIIDNKVILNIGLKLEWLNFYMLKKKLCPVDINYFELPVNMFSAQIDKDTYNDPIFTKLIDTLLGIIGIPNVEFIDGNALHNSMFKYFNLNTPIKDTIQEEIELNGNLLQEWFNDVQLEETLKEQRLFIDV